MAPVRNVLLAGYVGVMVVALIVYLYYASVTTTTPVTPTDTTPLCVGGVYCNGQPIVGSASRVGMSQCGANNRKMTCIAGVNGAAPTWTTYTIECNPAYPNRCA